MEKEIKEKESILLKMKNEFNIINNSTKYNLNIKFNNLKNKNLSNNNPIIEDSLKKIESYKPLSEYKYPTLIGLNNIGATCFMNATLQCLSQTKDLTNYFLKESNKYHIINNNFAINNKNNLQLSPAYLELIQHLWDKNRNNSFSPTNFMNIVEKMNPLFKQGQAGDSKDFIIFILEQLHKELKKSIKSLNRNRSAPNITISLNQYDKNNAFNHFFEEFQKECSIISDVFFGFNETTNECLNCKNNYNSKGINNPICYNYGIFNCLIFPLEEVKKMKNISMQNYNYINIPQNNCVSIYECFYYNQKTDLFSGDNKNYCNICKQLFNSLYTSKIFSGPQNLVLILNRGKNNIYNVKIDFTETIDITEYVSAKDKPKIMYNLYGVITHIGQSGPNAHFVASCKSPIDNNWYRYNDSLVNKITNIRKEVIDFGTPYILFYEKI